METSLHLDLKKHYAGQDAQTEVVCGGYRIDAVRDGMLIEIQHGSLAAIRDKIARLLVDHRVLVVKPIVASKLLVRHDAAGGRVLSRRKSPRRGKLLDAFEELIYFTRVFPHPRLALELVLVEIEEWRCPGHGRRRRWRRDDQVTLDQRLLAIGQSVRLETAADLLRLLTGRLPRRFHSGHLAEQCGVARHVAQRIAYCLRKMEAVRQVAKTGNTLVYERVPRSRRRTDAA